MQSDERGSITQIFTQGVDGGEGGSGALMGLYLGGGAADEKSAETANFGKLLGRAGDVPRLAADLPLRDPGHCKSGDQRRHCRDNRAP